MTLDNVVVISPTPLVDDFVARGSTSLRQRRARLRSKAWQIGQCAIAAGVAWWLAHDVLGHQSPFFAPVVAVVSLGTTYGQRRRRVVEMSVGVALGIALGDLYTHVLGRGLWQIALMVAVAMTVAVLLDASPLLVNQVAIQSLFVVTVLPSSHAVFGRWVDALVGGGVAVLAATVVPQAPLRRPRDQAAVVVRKIAALLRSSATSARSGNVEAALTGLADARATDPLVAELRAAADEGLSVVGSSPFRRGHREHVRLMHEMVEPLDFALRNTRVLARRVAVSSYREERIPEPYLRFVDELADLVDAVAVELEAGRMAVAVQERLTALALATSHAPRSALLDAEVVLAQVRSVIADLLVLTGMDPLEATAVIPPLDA